VSQIHNSSDKPTKNSWGLRNQEILVASLNKKKREIRQCGNSSYNFSILIRTVYDVAPSCWNHTVACVFPVKLPYTLYIRMVLNTSSLLALLYITQHKIVSLLCWTLHEAVLLEKQIVTQLVKKYPAIYRTMGPYPEQKYQKLYITI
jgi:hypothetical protein